MEFSSYLYENQASFQDAVTSALTRLQEFLKKTKYTVSQINGSRILEVPKFSDLQEPEKGSEIFISKIPQLIFEDELMPLFSSVGIVYRMRLMLCFSGANKGFCYVQYINPQVASSAVEKLNGYEIREKRYLSVKKSIDNRRLFFGNIPKEIAREAIEDKLNSVLKDVNKYFVYSDEKDTNKNRGFVFVEFKTHRSAALTRRLYSKGFVLWGNNINVDWATPEEEIDDTQLLDVTDLFLRCITPGISDREIKAKIKHSLPQRTRFKVTKIRDFAFIHFEDHESAELGLKYLKETGQKIVKMGAQVGDDENTHAFICR
ncbi:APOBEC1 complementation factor-like [Lycorma delicatula]|uniref:APOBEC1 complementation factor-like n=1 Tax=Lycorma delicatula TaxID=130591 RepID=UPI003F517DD1